MRALLSSLRVVIQGKELLQTTTRPFIIALWHNQLSLVPILEKLLPNTPLRIIISNSRDGALLAQLASTYKNVSITRVRHNRRHQALTEMIQALENGKEILLITPDGPRGPMYQVKPGVIFSAQKTKVAIISMRWTASRFWQFSTWDRTRLPKPFSRVAVTFEGPFLCHPETDMALLQQQLAEQLLPIC